MTRWTTSALAAALTITLAPFAFAGGAKPAKPPAAPAPTTPAPTTESNGSLAEIEESADAAEKAANRELRRRRYERIVAYLAANPKADDAEKALGAAMDLAEEVEDWPRTIEHADAYVKAYPDGSRKVDALLTKAGAVSKSGSKEDMKKAYDAAFAAVDVGSANPNSILSAYATYADALVDLGDTEAAKAVYQALKDAYASHGAADQVSRIAESWSQNLDAIGKAPAAIEDAKDLDGKAVGLADYKDKVLLIDFWATWCAPCRAEIPNVMKAYARFHDQGFEVLGISIDHDAESLKKYVAEKKMPWRQVFDADKTIANAYGVEGIPHTLLVGRDGKVIRVGLRGDALERALEKAFAKPAAPSPNEK